MLTELSDEALTITIRLIDLAIFPLRSAYSLYKLFFSGAMLSFLTEFVTAPNQ